MDLYKRSKTCARRAGWLIRAVLGVLGSFLFLSYTGAVGAQPRSKPITVTIAVKPGDSPTTLEPKRGGMVPIAILSTREFDATRLDVETVKAGATGSEATIFRSAQEDVDKDGDVDLLLLFRLPDMKLQCSDLEIRITGKTDKGEGIEGKQKVTMQGC